MTAIHAIPPGAQSHPQPGQSWSSLTRRKPAAAYRNGHQQVLRPAPQQHPTRDNPGCLLLTPHNQVSGILPVERVDKDT
jgi:hypothetical protein